MSEILTPTDGPKHVFELFGFPPLPMIYDEIYEVQAVGINLPPARTLTSPRKF